MCTLILWWRIYDGQPLIVAANRDEKLDRPAAPPSLREHEGARFIAPTDLTAGGTWLGLDAAGTFVGITNRFPARPNHPSSLQGQSLRSRGLLVLDALAAGGAAAVDRALSALDPAAYDGFHLVAVDRRFGVIVWNDGVRVHRVEMSPGVTILTERSFGAGPTRRIARIEQSVEPWRAAPSDAELIELLSARDPDGFEGINVSVPAIGYGTRSSSIVRLTGDGARMLHADGPPDKTPFVDLADLVGALTSRDPDPSRPRTTRR